MFRKIVATLLKIQKEKFPGQLFHMEARKDADDRGINCFGGASTGNISFPYETVTRFWEGVKITVAGPDCNSCLDIIDEAIKILSK